MYILTYAIYTCLLGHFHRLTTSCLIIYKDHVTISLLSSTILKPNCTLKEFFILVKQSLVPDHSRGSRLTLGQGAGPGRGRPAPGTGSTGVSS